VCEIKFRVFDPNTNNMVGTDVGIDKIHLFDFDGDNITEQEGLVIMQYTGLKDKNGKEIYKSDLVEDNIGIGFVEFLNGAYRVNYRNGSYKWFIDFLDSEKSGLEVIGNIYDNPDLING